MNKKKHLIHAGISFCVTFAMMNIGRIPTTSIVLLCVFAGSFLLLEKTNLSVEKREQRCAGVTAALFTLFTVLADYAYLSGDLTSRLFIAVYLFLTAAGLFFLFRFFILLFLKAQSEIILFEGEHPFPTKLFVTFTAILFLCFLPFLLMNFPAVMTPDSLSQYRQVIGTETYSNHHPWLHTMLFQLFYEIGFAISKDTYIAISFYTVFQMFVTACCESYALAALHEIGLKKKYCIAGLILFIICPYHLLYSVTIWKDILFSMAVLVLTVTTFRLFHSIRKENNPFHCKRDIVLYTISGFLMCMFRHNGLYAFLVSTIILIVVLRKYRKSFVPVNLAILIAVIVIKGPIMDACGVKGGEFAYNVCVPLQQIARVITNGRELTQEETDLLSKINDISYIPEHYQKGGADPMFAWVLYGNQDYLIEHKGEYLKLWIEIGLRYPGDYVQAYIDQTRGYWYPMDPEQVVYFGITENEDGLIAKPVIKGPAAVKCNELLTKLYTMIPVYGILYSMGGLFWILIVCFAASFCSRRYDMLPAYLPVFLLMVTVLIAVPLVADVRYGYPMMLTAPVLFFLTFYKEVPKTQATISCDTNTVSDSPQP
ncbi:MAG: DUF6020 family protein [Lachnospiraceae bacterium]